MPHTEAFCWYSFHPEPERYPRATHSTGKGLAFFTSMDRPSSSEAYSDNSAGYSRGDAEIR